MTIEKQVNDAMRNYQMISKQKNATRTMEIGMKAAQCITAIADDIAFLKANGSQVNCQPAIDALAQLQEAIKLFQPPAIASSNTNRRWTDTAEHWKYTD